MLQISEVNIFSLSKEEDMWSIEGEIIFEDDLTSAFETGYLPDEDELDDLSLELELEEFDQKTLKTMILDAVNNFEE
ncbi:MAG TPA: hypothetical protein H9733_08780 [Candidatus Anaerotignum merdipullorum]|nr:hypothetical protein [Candidatus Anaerotignum merdipullorum]